MRFFQRSGVTREQRVEAVQEKAGGLAGSSRVTLVEGLHQEAFMVNRPQRQGA